MLNIALFKLVVWRILRFTFSILLIINLTLVVVFKKLKALIIVINKGMKSYFLFLIGNFISFFKGMLKINILLLNYYMINLKRNNNSFNLKKTFIGKENIIINNFIISIKN